MKHNELDVAWPPAGRYVLAVSGGADSMVLLDLMAAAAGERGYELVMAHFDHGLRSGSAADAAFVREAARRYGLPFESARANLGPAAGEAAARAARHHWLAKVSSAFRAAAVVTAHHRDDLLETSLLNLARGTGRRGLAPMRPGGPILRPLLGLPRAELRAYAAARGLTWREDPTNADTSNPRNLLRHVILPNAKDDWQEHYLELLERLGSLNNKIEQSLTTFLEDHRSGASGYSFPRALVRDLSLTELEELLAAASRRLRPAAEFDRRVVQELALFAKTAVPHRRRPLRKDLSVVVDPQSISVYYIGTSDR